MTKKRGSWTIMFKKLNNFVPLRAIVVLFGASAFVFILTTNIFFRAMAQAGNRASGKTLNKAGSTQSSHASSVSPHQEEEKYNYVGAIISALKNPSVDVRLRTLDIIAERPSLFQPDKIKPLLTEDKDADVKMRAAVVLAAMNDRSGVAYLRSVAFTKPKLSPKPTVVERMKYFSAQNMRIKAIINLGKIKDYPSLSLLEAETKDEDGRVADAAWIALAYLGNKKGVDIFVHGLKNTDRLVRAKAAEVVGDIGASEGIIALRERLNDWDKDVRIAAIRSLGKLKDIQSAPKLREIIFSDKEQAVREAAARALGEMRDSAENVSFLKKYLYDENIAVRLAVCQSLAKLGDYSGRDFVKALAERGAEKEARRSAVRAFENFPIGDEDRKILSSLIYDDDPLTSLEAIKVLAFSDKKNTDFTVGKTTGTQGVKK